MNNINPIEYLWLAAIAGLILVQGMVEQVLA